MNKPARYALLGIGAVVGAVVGMMAAQGRLGINPVLLMLIFFAVTGGLVWLGLRGNKGGAPADPATRARALDGAADGSARLIVIREGFVGKLSGIDVLVDGRAATQLKSPRFAVLPLAPGRHSIQAKVAMQSKLLGPIDLDLAAGETAAIRIVVELGAARLERETWDPGLRARLDQIPMVAA